MSTSESLPRIKQVSIGGVLPIQGYITHCRWGFAFEVPPDPNDKSPNGEASYWGEFRETEEEATADFFEEFGTVRTID
jgi:hypothetical protein